MIKYTIKIERGFENMTAFITKILGSSITFLLALCLVIYWWSTNLFSSNNCHQNIGDIIFGITFLSLFIIQKSFNRYSILVNLKLNELVSSHIEANNSVLNTQKKTESEITELVKEYIEDEVKEIENFIIKNK
jgi:low affinity Fe/Cu permease